MSLEREGVATPQPSTQSPGPRGSLLGSSHLATPPNVSPVAPKDHGLRDPASGLAAAGGRASSVAGQAQAPGPSPTQVLAHRMPHP